VVGVNAELVRELRGEIAEKLTARHADDEAAARARMSAESERQYGRSLIADAILEHATRSIGRGEAALDPDREDEIGQAVFDALFGLGRLQRLLEDDTITDIHVNGHDQVFVKRLDGSVEPSGPVADSDDELVELIRLAATRFGRSERRFDTASPELNLRLPDGSRLFAVQAVSERPSLAVRIHRHQKVTLADLRGLGMFDEGVHAFFEAAVRSRQNLIIAGGTGVGKTTLLRGCANAIEANERLVTVEDSLELGLDDLGELHPNVVSFEERRANIEGEGAITLADLVRWALRMDPDRVIVGEVRGDEILPMLNAMSQGNDGSMCTVHADSSVGVFSKLALYAMQTPQRLPLEATNLLVANAIDFVVFVATGADGLRQVASIREVTGAEDRLVLSNEVFAPGRDGRAEPAVRVRDRTLAELTAAGLDPALLLPLRDRR
jgi:pilus assembly protein CpaF